MTRWLPGWRYILIVVGLVVLVLLIMDFNSRMEEWRQFNCSERAGQRPGDQPGGYKYLPGGPDGICYIRSGSNGVGLPGWALGTLGDYLVVPLSPDGGGVSTQVPSTIVVREPIENWQLWLSLFFDPTMRGGAVAARRAHNPKVLGSNPSPATLNKP
jgi:hypothetical protein